MKILIVRFSSIGDIVLTTPVIRALKEQIPGIEIHYLTKGVFRALLENNPHIDQLHNIDRSIDEVLSRLKSEKFDRIIDLHHNVRTKSLQLKLGVRMHSFPKLNLKKWLLVNFKYDSLPKVHVVDRYFEAVKELGVQNQNYPIEFHLSEEDRVDVQIEFGLTPGAYVTMAIGAQFSTKRMPTDLLCKIISKTSKPVVLIGGKEDGVTADEVINRIQSDQAKVCPKVINACGWYRIGQSADIVRQSERILTNDTGMMHIASAFDLPIHSVWGSTVPAFGMYPYRPADATKISFHEVLGLNCRPCSKIGFKDCPKKHFRCMLDQDTEKIVMQLNSVE